MRRSTKLLGRRWKRPEWIPIIFLLLFLLLNSSFHNLTLLLHYTNHLMESTVLDPINNNLWKKTHIPIDDNVRKKAGILTTHSLCRMSRWIYTIKNIEKMKLVDLECSAPPQPLERMLHNSSTQLMNATPLIEGDTIFVPFTALQNFVDDILVNLTVNVAVFSGQTRLVHPASNSAISKLIGHPKVMIWFCQNLPVYGGINPYHPKVSPFPYGLVDVEWYSPGIYGIYKQFFFDTLRQNKSLSEKEEFVYVGPIGETNSNRSKIPQGGKKLRPREFFMKMANARYIISPNGDRPECYRHYEAIGLGMFAYLSFSWYLAFLTLIYCH